MTHRIWNLSERIQHSLMLKSKLLSDVGLLNGKMGMAIEFGHLYKQTLNEVFDDCMSEFSLGVKGGLLGVLLKQLL